MDYSCAPTAARRSPERACEWSRFEEPPPVGTNVFSDLFKSKKPMRSRVSELRSLTLWILPFVQFLLDVQNKHRGSMFPFLILQGKRRNDLESNQSNRRATSQRVLPGHVPRSLQDIVWCTLWRPPPPPFPLWPPRRASHLVPRRHLRTKTILKIKRGNF